VPPFQRFLDEHADAVLRFLSASVGRTDADDVFQETFIAALRAYPRLRPDSNLRAWVLTIAHRKALDHHRARARRPVPVAAFDREPAAPDDAEERDEDLWAAVQHLPDRQRGAVLLRVVGDLPHRDVAATLGCSEEAARRALSDGLAKLRKEWTPA
jgi:RNA polymerase sigma factor (sigma-70 family)